MAQDNALTPLEQIEQIKPIISSNLPHNIYTADEPNVRGDIQRLDDNEMQNVARLGADLVQTPVINEQIAAISMARHIQEAIIKSNPKYQGGVIHVEAGEKNEVTILHPVPHGRFPREKMDPDDAQKYIIAGKTIKDAGKQIGVLVKKELDKLSDHELENDFTVHPKGPLGDALSGAISRAAREGQLDPYINKSAAGSVGIQYNPNDNHDDVQRPSTQVRGASSKIILT